MGELSRLKGLGPKSERCLNEIGRTYLGIPRVSRCESTAAPARRAAQHSTRCTGQRRNAAGVGAARTPLGALAIFTPLALRGQRRR